MKYALRHSLVINFIAGLSTVLYIKLFYSWLLTPAVDVED